MRHRALLLFLADTGCRVGGLVGLGQSDVDCDAGTAMVTEKGGKSRLVMFTRPTAGALRRYLRQRDTLSKWVFPNLKTGHKMLASSVNHIIERIAERAGGVQGPHNPHAFRHAFAREYILNGGDMGTLSDILGHSDISVTKQYYSRFSVAELQKKHKRYSPVAHLEMKQ